VHAKSTNGASSPFKGGPLSKACYKVNNMQVRATGKNLRPFAELPDEIPGTSKFLGPQNSWEIITGPKATRNAKILGFTVNSPGTSMFLGDHYWDPKATRMPRYWDSNSPGTPMFLGDHYWEPQVPERLVG
jgi:hypothetical protein